MSNGLLAIVMKLEDIENFGTATSWIFNILKIYYFEFSRFCHVVLVD
jgi:hypothetical protein